MLRFPHALIAYLSLPLLADVAQPRAGGKGVTKVVEGVPIYNYQRLHEQGRSAGVSNLRSGTYDWILMLRGHGAHAGLGGVCNGRSKDLECIGEGHPSRGGVAYMTIRTSEVGLGSLLRDQSEKVAFVEPDGLVQGGTEVPEAKGSGGHPPGAGLAGSASARRISWGLDRIDNRHAMDGRFNVSLHGRGVHVYLADTGIMTTHSDFEGRAIPTLEVLGRGLRECSANDTTCALDRFGHGTHTAGIVGGKDWGVANKVTLHAVKVLGDDNWGRYSWWIAALDWIAANGERPAVVSASLGGRGTPALALAVDAVTSAGVTVVVSAGNEYSDACNFMPSGVRSAITVGATGLDDFRASYSNFGSCVDIFAPGSHIVSAFAASNTALAVMSGTSMACPHAAGAVAMLLEAEPATQPARVAEKLTASATAGVLSGIRANSPNLLLYVGHIDGDAHARPPREPVCDKATWPDVDHAFECGSCKVLVRRFFTSYRTCDRYCARLNRLCTGAWHSKLNTTCAATLQAACDQMVPSASAICECAQEGHASR